jgi:hypothetical protein
MKTLGVSGKDSSYPFQEFLQVASKETPIVPLDGMSSMWEGKCLSIDIFDGLWGFLKDGFNNIVSLGKSDSEENQQEEVDLSEFTVVGEIKESAGVKVDKEGNELLSKAMELAPTESHANFLSKVLPRAVLKFWA